MSTCFPVHDLDGSLPTYMPASYRYSCHCVTPCAFLRSCQTSSLLLQMPNKWNRCLDFNLRRSEISGVIVRWRRWPRKLLASTTRYKVDFIQASTQNRIIYCSSCACTSTVYPMSCSRLAWWQCHLFIFCSSLVHSRTIESTHWFLHSELHLLCFTFGTSLSGRFS